MGQNCQIWVWRWELPKLLLENLCGLQLQSGVSSSLTEWKVGAFRGNVIDQEVYQKGTACNACGAGASCNATNGLCIVAK